MQYRQFGDTFLVRLDRGEEITAQLKALVTEEKIKLAQVSAIGAVDEVTVGVYKVSEQKYYANHFQGDFEIVSLSGTIDTMDDECYTHLHISVGDSQGRVFGGHLTEARVSATCEMVVRLLDGRINRQRDEATGLNVWQLST